MCVDSVDGNRGAYTYMCVGGVETMQWGAVTQETCGAGPVGTWGGLRS